MNLFRSIMNGIYSYKCYVEIKVTVLYNIRLGIVMAMFSV